VKPSLRHFGESQSPVVVIDDFTGAPEEVARVANALAPFPSIADNHYPGLRRLISRSDAEADAYVERACNDAAQFIAGAFGTDRFDLVEASFSLVTSRPDQLTQVQRAPHFDSTDQK
jgi:hypothetical protein